MMYSFGASGKMEPVNVPANSAKNSLPIGTIIKLNGYSYPDYVVIKNLGVDPKNECYGSSYQTINLSDGSIGIKQAYSLKYLSEKKDDRIQCYITDQVLSAEEIMDAIDFSKAKKIESIRLAQEKEQARAADREYLLNTYSYLEKREGSKKTPWALGAANIRVELKKAFPGVKFSVTSESFSMGCAIRVEWNGGPTVKEVENIVDKYEYGTFDSMTDCAGYKDEQFTGIFGGAKYVTTSRREEVNQNG